MSDYPHVEFSLAGDDGHLRGPCEAGVGFRARDEHIVDVALLLTGDPGAVTVVATDDDGAPSTWLLRFSIDGVSDLLMGCLTPLAEQLSALKEAAEQ